MKIIALWGPGNVGKTTTVKKFLVKVLGKYGDSCMVQSSHITDRQNLINEIAKEKLSKKLNSRSPVRNVFCKLKIDGHLIGITTTGDNVSSLDEAFNTFADCEICFCATHIRGGTVDFVVNAAGNDALIWYQQSKVSSHGTSADLMERYQSVSDSMSDVLFMELEGFLDGNYAY